MKTKELRNLLAEALDRCSKGKLPIEDGKNIVNLATQITSNMAVELKHQKFQEHLGRTVQSFGDTEIN